MTGAEKWQSDRERLLQFYSTWLPSDPAFLQMSTNMSDEGDSLDGLDQPIALRRSKRRSDAISPTKPTAVDPMDGGATNNLPLTPSKARSIKRVRFSHPGHFAVSSSGASSGLTPFVRRTTLSTPRRSVSTSAAIRAEPIEIQFTPFRQVLDERAKRRIRRNGLSDEMHAYDLDRRDKTQLGKDLRAKDEENQRLKDEIESLKRTQADTSDHQRMYELSSSQRVVEAELETLRQSFNEASMPAGFDDDMDINWDAVNVRKAGIDPGPASDSGDTIPIYEDDADIIEPSTPLAKNVNPTARQLVDTTADGELLAMALDLETAKQEKRQLFKDLRTHIHVSQSPALNFPTAATALHFADSPASSQQDQQTGHFCLTSSTSSLPSPPKTFYADLSKALKTTTHRAESAEVALHALESDLSTLGFSPSDTSTSSTNTILSNIRAHFREARLDLERALPGEIVSGLNEPAKILPEAISKLKVLSCRVQEREAELRSMHEQQRTLKGNFECGLRAAEKANQRIKELEAAVEEGADELLNMRMKLQANEKDGVEKDHTITSLIAALDKYRADVARLEGLVVQLENEQSFRIQEGRDESGIKIEELEAKIAAEETGRRKAEESAGARAQRIEALQAALDAATNDASALQLQISALEAQKRESEVAARRHSQERDEQRHAALQNLNTRISALSTALAASTAESDRLGRLVAKLQSRLLISEEASTRAVETLWQEQVRSVTKIGETRKSYVRGCKVRNANWSLEDEDEKLGMVERAGDGASEPMTPVSLVRFVDVEQEEEEGVEGRVEIERGRGGRGKGKERRGLGIAMKSARRRGHGHGHASGERRGQRLDSGIGMGSLSEVDEDEDEHEDEHEHLDLDLDHDEASDALSSDAVLPSSELELPQ